jgi:hypothetical protein
MSSENTIAESKDCTLIAAIGFLCVASTASFGSLHFLRKVTDSQQIKRETSVPSRLTADNAGRGEIVLLQTSSATRVPLFQTHLSKIYQRRLRCRGTLSLGAPQRTSGEVPAIN